MLIDELCPLLGPVPDDWPAVEVVRRIGRFEAVEPRLDTEHAVFSLGDGGILRIDAQARRAEFHSARRLPVADLVHPYLAPVGATFAWWGRREAFHAGAFRLGDVAWGVLGEKGAGKSSTLASLALHGHDVLTDDLVVVADGAALAGPRCIDLRASAFEHLGVGEPTSRRPEPRWRFELDPAPSSAPLAGWIVLEWGDAVALHAISGADRLMGLLPHRSMLVAPRDDAAPLLDAAALPMWRLVRPQRWEAFPDALDRLLEALDGS